MRNLEDNKIERLANYLQGTCKSIDESLEYLFDINEDDMSLEDCMYLDQLVFCCEDCGWWLCTSEMAENEENRWICEECNYYKQNRL